MHRIGALAVIVGILLAGTPAHAAGTGGCDSFAWPLAAELALVKAGDATPVASGSQLDLLPAKAVALKLAPQASVALLATPSGKPKQLPETAFAGTVTVGSLEHEGLYQVSLSGPGWIDVVQNGAALASVAHTGKSDCDGIRKSVRFMLGQGPVGVQITNAPSDAITVVIRKADGADPGAGPGQ
jgi:hypothetical protein